jgi:uncharacterized protein YjbI with pentapeptide repeats
MIVYSLEAAMAGKAKRMDKSLGMAQSSANDQHTPSTAQAFAAKAKDLGALREAVVDAAGVGAGLWISYLFLFLYLFIAVAAVTHRDLLFENPVKLPFLNVELSLVGFFVVGPLLFLVLQAYVLLHFAMLAGKIGVFHSELQAQIKDDDTRARLRRQLPSNIFVQYLAGPYEMRTGIMGFMLRLIALISLVLFPIALLVFFQLQFLPYHNALITWWHRIAVLLGILLLWMLWPSIARGQTTWISWHDFRRWKIMTLVLASLLPLFLVFTVATFPGEWLDSNLPSLPLVPTTLPSLESAQTRTNQTNQGDLSFRNSSRQNDELSENKKETEPSLKKRWRGIVDLAKSMERKVIRFANSMEWTSLHKLLVAGDVDLVARKPTSLWSNRLVLPGVDVIDQGKFDSEEKIAAVHETLSLRGRDLEGAVLIGSGLRKADFTAARLQGANLYAADLRDARFGCALSPDQEQDCAAQLQGAYLVWANLQGADLGDANLQGAALREAQLEGARLSHAGLQGADLSNAKLQGADLSNAKLQGANLWEAQLEGADLSEAELQGADLGDANLQGADLSYCELQGADLSNAKLQGANLWEAQLEGADLSEAELQGTDLTDAEIWLASFPDSLWGQSPVPIGLAHLKTSPPTMRHKAALKENLRTSITDGQLLRRLVHRLYPILRDDPPKWHDEASWRGYSKAGEPSPDELAQYLVSMACGRDGTAQIAHGLAARAKVCSLDCSRDDARLRYVKPVAEALLKINCKGEKTLTEETRATLESLVSATK